MRRAILLILSAGLAACAGTPAWREAPPHLLRDDLFAAPAERIAAEEIFALSPAMRDFLGAQVAGRKAMRREHLALVDALFGDRTPWLEYDATFTRTAAEAFEARAGNCLSLVVMTAALARHLGLQVRYQQVESAPAWARSEGLILRSGHVNLVIGPAWSGQRAGFGGEAVMIDFLPQEDLRGLRTREIPESTVVAMFMNNRAVEAMVQGRLDDGYGWARAALRYAPEFAGTYNTLALLYLRRADLAQAAVVLEHLLARWPRDRDGLSNLALVYERMGRDEPAQALRRRLAQLEPVPPYHYFQRGREALAHGQADEARRHFERELARDRYNAEVHYWLGRALIQLGELRAAERALQAAVDFSTRAGERALYGGKLGWLRAQGARREGGPPAAASGLAAN